jgi:hypothetical protein
VRLFGGVDQQEKERERAGRHSALGDGESVDQPEQPVEGWRVRIAVAPGPSRDTQPLDDRERLVTFEPPDYPPEGARKPPDILVEREIFFARSSRVWHGVKIPQSSASEKGNNYKLQTATEDYLPGAMSGAACGRGPVVGEIACKPVANSRSAESTQQVVFRCSCPSLNHHSRKYQLQGIPAPL